MSNFQDWIELFFCSAVLVWNIKFKALNFAPEGRGMNTHLGGS
jgi:hypothetical protein